MRPEARAGLVGGRPGIRFWEHHSVPQNLGFEPPFWSLGGAPSGAPRMVGGAPDAEKPALGRLHLLVITGIT
jgi:hypothetical protein